MQITTIVRLVRKFGTKIESIPSCSFSGWSTNNCECSTNRDAPIGKSIFNWHTRPETILNYNYETPRNCRQMTQRLPSSSPVVAGSIMSDKIFQKNIQRSLYSFQTVESHFKRFIVTPCLCRDAVIWAFINDNSRNIMGTRCRKWYESCFVTRWI